MRPIFISGMAAFVLALASCGSANFRTHLPGDGRGTLENALDSVVALVEVDDEGLHGPTCTAFFISETDLITAGHCVSEVSLRIAPGPNDLELDVTFEDPEDVIGRQVNFITRNQYNEWVGSPETDRTEYPEYFSATVLALISPEEDDLALLRISGLTPRAQHWLPIRNWSNDAPIVGEEVWALGLPVGEPWVLTSGIIARVQINLDNSLQIYHDARIGHGSSGSPLLDSLGNVIGINVQISRENIVGKATPSTIIQTLYRLYETRREIEELDEARS